MRTNNKWSKGMSPQVNHRWEFTLNPAVERCTLCDLRRKKRGTSYVYGRREGVGIAFGKARPNCVVTTTGLSGGVA